jgi:hypothetical protein
MNRKTEQSLPLSASDGASFAMIMTLRVRHLGVHSPPK